MPIPSKCVQVLLAVTTACVAACSSNTTEGAEARFTLESVGGKAITVDRAGQYCSTVINGSLVFSNWGSQSVQQVALQHKVVHRSTSHADTILVHDIASYRRTGMHGTIAFANGGSASFTISPDGASVVTSDAGCFPGQDQAIVDIAFPLVYAR